jgi:hypothetical protein
MAFSRRFEAVRPCTFSWRDATSAVTSLWSCRADCCSGIRCGGPCTPSVLFLVDLVSSIFLSLVMGSTARGSPLTVAAAASTAFTSLWDDENGADDRRARAKLMPGGRLGGGAACCMMHGMLLIPLKNAPTSRINGQ